MWHQSCVRIRWQILFCMIVRCLGCMLSRCRAVKDRPNKDPLGEKLVQCNFVRWRTQLVTKSSFLLKIWHTHWLHSYVNNMLGFVLYGARSASECLRLNPNVTRNSHELWFSIAYVIRESAGKHALNTPIDAQKKIAILSIKLICMPTPVSATIIQKPSGSRESGFWIAHDNPKTAW